MPPLHLKLLTQRKASVISTPFPAGSTPPGISSSMKSGRERPRHCFPNPACGTEECQVCETARKTVHFVVFKQEEIVLQSVFFP